MTETIANVHKQYVIAPDENGVIHTAYGSRGFFARPASEVPTDQIYGGGND